MKLETIQKITGASRTVLYRKGWHAMSNRELLAAVVEAETQCRQQAAHLLTLADNYSELSDLLREALDESHIDRETA